MVKPDIVITVNRVKDVLHDLNVNSAVGPKSGHFRLLRACAHELSVPLTLIINKSLEERVPPSVWLKSIIVPLFKAKSRYDPMNYRPVKVSPHDATLLHETGSSNLNAHCTTLFHGVASVCSNVGYEGALLQWNTVQTQSIALSDI